MWCLARDTADHSRGTLRCMGLSQEGPCVFPPAACNTQGSQARVLCATFHRGAHGGTIGGGICRSACARVQEDAGAEQSGRTVGTVCIPCYVHSSHIFSPSNRYMQRCVNSLQRASFVEEISVKVRSGGLKLLAFQAACCACFSDS